MEPGALSKEKTAKRGKSLARIWTTQKKSLHLERERADTAEELPPMNETQFRFQDLEIWKRGASISRELFRLADELEERKLFRFAEQLRGAVLSITNNIAEGSGSAF